MKQIKISTGIKKHFNFKLYIRTSQGQEFLIKSLGIDAENYDLALKKFNSLDLPFHHFSTVKQIF